MFEKFTEASIKVIVLSQEESRKLDHNYVGTEQLLLGLLSEQLGIAARSLYEVGITLDGARIAVEKLIGRGSGVVTLEMPFTEVAKRCLEASLTAAQDSSDDFISTEHLLLGLLAVQDKDNLGLSVLESLGIDAINLRRVVFSDMSRQKAILERAENRPAEENLNETLKCSVRALRHYKESSIKVQEFENAGWSRDLENKLIAKIQENEPSWSPIGDSNVISFLKFAVEGIRQAKLTISQNSEIQAWLQEQEKIFKDKIKELK
jgi:ATP-dependent Clp protease ATP-binding subunit ClpA